MDEQAQEELTIEERLTRAEAALGLAGRVAGSAINNHESRLKAVEAQCIMGSVTDLLILVSLYVLIRQVGKVSANASVS